MSFLASATLTIMVLLAGVFLVGAAAMYLASRRVQARVRELEESLGVGSSKS